VEARWKAAVEAGVDLVASDQYEELAAWMRQFDPLQGARRKGGK